MTKIVINNCYGGLSLSEKGVMRYVQFKGFPICVRKDAYDRRCYYKMSEEEYKKSTEEERDECYFYPHNITRDDPDLIRVIEELGEEADGSFAELKIIEIPDDVEWEIGYHDYGEEWVAEKHRTWF